MDRLASGAISLWGKWVILLLLIWLCLLRFNLLKHVFVMITVFFLIRFPLWSPTLCFPFCDTTNLVTIMSSSPQKVARILVLKGVAGTLLATLFLSAGNPQLTFTTLLGFLRLIIFVSVLIPCSFYIDDRHTGEIQLSSSLCQSFLGFSCLFCHFYDVNIVFLRHHRGTFVPREFYVVS